mmetsp:Transcript_138487/g.359897  ORF Transcript_138487/g.359897 Transcript_138487/m.359897 type:complete len:644 (+) Transcript_138487:55-1986(+)
MAHADEAGAVRGQTESMIDFEKALDSVLANARDTLMRAYLDGGHRIFVKARAADDEHVSKARSCGVLPEGAIWCGCRSATKEERAPEISCASPVLQLVDPVQAEDIVSVAAEPFNRTGVLPLATCDSVQSYRSLSMTGLMSQESEAPSQAQVHWPARLRIGKPWSWGVGPAPQIARFDEASQSDHSASDGSHEPVYKCSRLRSLLEASARQKSSGSDNSSHQYSLADLRDCTSGEALTALIDLAMGMIIVVNALTLGIRVDNSPYWWGWILVDVCFAVVFSVDIIGKLWYYGCKAFFGGKDRSWHIYESIIVSVAYAEIGLTLSPYNPGDSGGVFAALRVLRLARIARILSIIRIPIFTDLVMMIDGTVGGFKTLLWSQLLIAVPLYVVALLFRETLGKHADAGQGAQYFGSLSMSFFTTFRCLVMGDCSTADGRPLMVEVSEVYGTGFAICYCVVSVFMTFGLYNVIIAIYVENTVAAAKFNELRLKQRRLRDERIFTQKAIELCTLVWHHHPNNPDKKALSSLSLEELSEVSIAPKLFAELRSNRRFCDILHELDIADQDQVDLFDTVDVDGNGFIGLEELVQGIAKLRGDARRSDIVSVSLMVRALQADFAVFQHSVSRQLKSLNRTASKNKNSHSSTEW